MASVTKQGANSLPSSWSSFNYHTFDRASFRHYLAWLTPIAQNVRKPDRLLKCCWKSCAVVGSLFQHVGRWNYWFIGAKPAERVIYSALTNGLTDTQRKTLDSLLDQKPLPDRIEVASRKAAGSDLLPGGLTEESRYVVRCN